MAKAVYPESAPLRILSQKIVGTRPVEGHPPYHEKNSAELYPLNVRFLA